MFIVCMLDWSWGVDVICPRCGSWIDEGEPYCPNCGYDGSDDEDDY